MRDDRYRVLVKMTVDELTGEDPAAVQAEFDKRVRPLFKDEANVKITHIEPGIETTQLGTSKIDVLTWTVTAIAWDH